MCYILQKLLLAYSFYCFFFFTFSTIFFSEGYLYLESVLKIYSTEV